ncbi:MAG: hypothetical protein K2M12_09990, partial [Muribaculaceae bacterium]|nr:hypothetical protein [Muribaculaceae bacterium]
MDGIKAKRLASVWWALLLIAGVYAELAYMAAWLGLWVDSTATVRCLKIMADAALIMLPYWLLPGRWRWTALIPVWGVAIMCICNSMYYRFFSDCMPIEALYQAGNTHGNMLRSIGGTLKVSDAIAVLIPVAVTALWCVPGVRRAVVAAKIRRSAAVVACVVSAAIFVAGQMAHNSAEQRELGYYFNREIGRGEAFRFRITDREPSQTAIHDSSLRQSGAVVYMLFELYYFLSRDSEIKLTDAERKRLDNIVLWPAGQDSVPGTNIVFIGAESQNADAVGRKAGGVA